MHFESTALEIFFLKGNVGVLEGPPAFNTRFPWDAVPDSSVPVPWCI